MLHETHKKVLYMTLNLLKAVRSETRSEELDPEVVEVPSNEETADDLSQTPGFQRMAALMVEEMLNPGPIPTLDEWQLEPEAVRTALEREEERAALAQAVLQDDVMNSVPRFPCEVVESIPRGSTTPKASASRSKRCPPSATW